MPDQALTAPVFSGGGVMVWIMGGAGRDVRGPRRGSASERPVALTTSNGDRLGGTDARSGLTVCGDHADRKGGDGAGDGRGGDDLANVHGSKASLLTGPMTRS